MQSLVALGCLAAGLGLVPAAFAQDGQGAEAAPPPESEAVLVELKAQAEAVRPLVESGLARAFLDRASELPKVEARTILRDAEARQRFRPDQVEALPQEQRERLTERVYGPRYYYMTSYGSPMIYARMLDVLARHGVERFEGRKVMDFGYGMIGQERMFALLGADVHGIEVEQLYATLYSWPGDTGKVEAADGTEGMLTLHHGRWPAEEKIVREVGGGFDVIMSKNTLKRGYINPVRETDPPKWVNLGVSDEEFLKAVHGALKPGGLLLAYNISGKQAPEDQKYNPAADGLFPFSRELVERAGFEVLAWDEADDERMIDIFVALGYDRGAGREGMQGELFTYVTVLRRGG